MTQGCVCSLATVQKTATDNEGLSWPPLFPVLQEHQKMWVWVKLGSNLWYPLVNVCKKLWTDPQFLMGKLSISMAIFKFANCLSLPERTHGPTWGWSFPASQRWCYRFSQNVVGGVGIFQACRASSAKLYFWLGAMGNQHHWAPELFPNRKLVQTTCQSQKCRPRGTRLQFQRYHSYSIWIYKLLVNWCDIGKLNIQTTSRAACICKSGVLSLAVPWLQQCTVCNNLFEILAAFGLWLEACTTWGYMIYGVVCGCICIYIYNHNIYISTSRCIYMAHTVKIHATSCNTTELCLFSSGKKVVMISTPKMCQTAPSSRLIDMASAPSYTYILIYFDIFWYT